MHVSYIRRPQLQEHPGQQPDFLGAAHVPNQVEPMDLRAPQQVLPQQPPPVQDVVKHRSFMCISGREPTGSDVSED
ncbi:uncharacterized protein APUU_10502S [Aspergillus puulaauensis]|uniref:Uncharacterized protein n=1 Tax=Aspergillus puulaauensis TaxID=1220207 RepID=A0A7R7XAD9_9EURO|nr:uncharacterized protein APUU_10502S [Aspergillus puulaauensis]BCS17674.1 hypothetical protein APUU_10502S [Aspergillus puulaauensis]